MQSAKLIPASSGSASLTSFLRGRDPFFIHGGEQVMAEGVVKVLSAVYCFLDLPASKTTQLIDMMDRGISPTQGNRVVVVTIVAGGPEDRNLEGGAKE